MTEWRNLRVNDIAAAGKSIVSGPFGSNISRKFFVDSGVPVIRGSNLTIGEKYFVEDEFVYITLEKAYELRNCEAKRGDLVFTAAGTLGQVGLIPEDSKFDRYIISNKQLRLRCDREKTHPLFLYYWFSNPAMVKHIENMNTGSSIPLINLSILKSLPVSIPSLETQRKIASVLSAYDDLIENNTRRIKALEEAAQTLYREWFVEFRFPGHEDVPLEDSGTEYGMIPQGWEIESLSNLCDLIMGQSPKSEFYNDNGEGLPFHQGVSTFGKRFPLHRRYSTAGNRIAEQDDILISVRAPVGRLNIADRKIILGRGLSSLRSKSEHQAFLFEMLRGSVFYEEDTMGGGTIFKSITKKDMQNIQLISPEISVLDKFEKIAQVLSKQVYNISLQNQRLKEARDVLLPRLVSGEIDTSDLEIMQGVD